MRIVIVTRDNVRRLLETAKSLAASGINGSNILMVDDSPSDRSIARNRVAVERAFERTPLILSKSNQEEILAWIPSETHRCLGGYFQLGKPDWNTYAARNVGLLWSARSTAGHRTLWLDDDVEISSHSIRLASRTPYGHISAFPLIGLPDFSRAKWIAMFLSCIDSATATEDAAPLAALLRAHTDLGVLTGTSQIPMGPFPLPWNSAHGAAYATNVALVKAPLFPAFCGEDYFWHRRQLDLGVSLIRRRAVVRHMGHRRELLNAPLFLGEELGAIQAACLRLVLSNPNLNVYKTLITLVARRCQELRRLAAKAAGMATASTQEQAARKVLDLLSSVSNELSSPQVWKSAAEQVEDSRSANLMWSRVGPSLAGKPA